MTQMPTVKPQRLIRYLKRLGFSEVRQSGSHKFFKHSDGRTTVVPLHAKDIGRGLLRAILDDIEISQSEFIREI
jgi:predicted RNA binding protein YcfA (HicA-like mRNA interferase family)